MYKNHKEEMILDSLSGENFHHDCFDKCVFGRLYMDIDFSRATFMNCDMSKIRFVRCNFADVDFIDCNLRSVDFDGCNLHSCRFISCKGDLLEYRTGKLLTEDLIGYKKCTSSKFGHETRIVKLKIPRGAIVFSINGYKCRTNTVEVLDIYDEYDGEHKDVAYSVFNGMSYHVGDKITVYNFDCDYSTECGEGIHFFMDEKSAIDYVF